MIVYGDPCRQDTLGALWERFRLRVSAPGPASVDALRTLLIEAGQIEQAVCDAGLPVRFEPVTNAAAAAFCAGAGSEAIACALDEFGPPGDSGARLSVKLPEGFAFYALFPEQYAAAAQSWAAEQNPSGGVLVVGVRSIGTTLSAVVTAALQAGGWDARRITVRPQGHPWSRTAHVGPDAAKETTWGLIVDEGPGLSGSSFASVADALIDAGLNPARLVFFPGHTGEPGPAASESVRAWWARTPRRVSPPPDLPALLAARTCELLGQPVIRTDDGGGGLWRGVVYEDPADWPAVCAPFERPKFRCVTHDGGAVLWKFAGLGSEAETAWARLSERAAAGWTVPPLDCTHGFIATPWKEGSRLCRADAADPNVLAHVGRYLVAVAGPPLAPGEGEAALTRLREMLYWNTWEECGEAAAEKSKKLEPTSDGAAALSYGDGRLAPHEWLRAGPLGKLLKTDAAGHEADHTMVGRQPLAWDIAGALVEWDLNDQQAAVLLAATGGKLFSPATLRFYGAAYAAFRVGQTTLCADMMAFDQNEQARLRHAAAGYRDALARAIGL